MTTMEGRLQAGDTVDFWQVVADVAYVMEGESAADQRERLLVRLDKYLNEWLAARPEIKFSNGSVNHFAMYAVADLVAAIANVEERGAKGCSTAARGEPMANDLKRRVGELADEIKRRDQGIEELRGWCASPRSGQ
jgi:hypothetical protein